MKMERGVRTGLVHGGITFVLQTQFSSFLLCLHDDTQGALRFPLSVRLSVHLSVRPFVTLYSIEFV